MCFYALFLVAAMASCFNNPKLILGKQELCIAYDLSKKGGCSLQDRELYPATLEFEYKPGEKVIYHNTVALYGPAPICFNNTNSHFTFVNESVTLKVKEETVTVTQIEAKELIYVKLSHGSGPAPQKGQVVMAHYTGMLLNSKVFDTSRGRQFPFMFHIGEREVISGWDLTFANMQAGEKGIMVVPYSYGYGENGFPPTIPPRATLVFEVELIQIN